MGGFSHAREGAIASTSTPINRALSLSLEEAGHDLARGTLSSILKQAGLKP